MGPAFKLVPMVTGYDALTEKEKEALRLLVSGYDAKSTATRLGLSVHTINERLRDARRKMSVSSSREAARLVHAAERGSPNFLGDEHLGDAASARSMTSQSDPDAGSNRSRRFNWVFGGVFMSITLALLAYAVLSDSARMPVTVMPVAADSVTAAETAAVQTTRQWLALVDTGDWPGSW